MKTKILGIFVCVLLIATALPAVGTMTEKEIPTSFRLGGNSLNYKNTPSSIINNNYAGMFIQLPYWSSSSPWGAPISDKDLLGGWIVYEDFWGISEPICDIHWWGITGEEPSIPGDPTGMILNITFYEDDGAGKPGNVVCEYSNVVPTIVKTGIVYYYEPTDKYWPLYYFTDVTLDPCCEISAGWVSIQSQNYLEIGVCFAWEPSPDGNNKAWQYGYNSQTWYMWPDDLAFVLTDGQPAQPDLECDGELSWSDIKPGTLINGSFEVRNNGDPTSILNWNTSIYPDWGVNWTFTPKASVLTPDMDWITVDVEVIAPEDVNEEFTGEIKIVNVENLDDYCIIDVSLATPVNQQVNIPPLLQMILERFPNVLPILRYIMGLQ